MSTKDFEPNAPTSSPLVHASKPQFKVTPVNEFKTAQDFFADFYKINQPDMSHRRFSFAIDWPSSLLGDIMQGRKPLTLNRAFEFAKFMELTSFQSEYLMMLAMREVTNEHVRHYANDFLQHEGTRFWPDTESALPGFSVLNEETFSDVDMLLIHIYLYWSQGRLNPQELQKHMPAFTQFQNQEYVLQILNKLIAKGIIEKNGNDYKILKTGLLSKTAGASAHKAYYDAYIQIAENQLNKVDWSAGTLTFPKKYLGELKEKRNALINWILSKDTHESQAFGRPEDHTILMLNLSSYEILDLSLNTPT